MICNRCGNQVPEGARFCNKCGAQFAAAPNNTANQFSANNQAPAYGQQNNQPQQQQFNKQQNYQQQTQPQQLNNQQQFNQQQFNQQHFNQPNANVVKPKGAKPLIIALAVSVPVLTVVVVVLAVAVFSGNKSSKPNTYNSVNNYSNDQTVEAQSESETTTAIPLSYEDKDFIESELAGMFLSQIAEYDCQTYSVRDAVFKYIFPISDSPIADIYFGVPQPGGGHGLDWISTDEKPDPLNKFKGGEYGPMQYIVLSKENVDYLLINVFNIPEEKVKNAPIEDYVIQSFPTMEDMYFYDGNFYKIVDGYGFEDEYFKVTAVTPLSDGKYEVTAENYVADWLSENPVEECVGTYKIIVEPKILNGEKHLSLYSSKQAS